MKPQQDDTNKLCRDFKQRVQAMNSRTKREEREKALRDERQNVAALQTERKA